jgi:BRCA1-associated protein
MPLYFYHLTFELYPYPRPLLERESTASNPKNTEAEPGEAQAWTPQPGSSIFETRDWPRHQRIGHLGETGEANIQLDRKEYEYLTGGRKQEGLKSSAAVGRGDGGVIDCGAAKGSPPSKAHDTTVTTRPPTAAASHSPAASPANPFEARDQRIAVQDYRFGQVRVESVDIIDMGERGERPSGRRRGESSISMGGTDGISAGLAGGESAVRVTKGRFEQLEGKNTEAGWGIVHLYRDGEETTGLNGPVLDTTHAQSHNAVAGGAAECVDGEKGKEGEPPEEDCTTLCIPAVPTYLTYNDFLGFAGKKAIEEISHFRMVMTGRSNRYMVLMKFRDPKAARRWKAEYDGKLFIEMEVLILSLLDYIES